MLAGFSGRLVSEDFLERRLENATGDAQVAILRRSLLMWRRRCRALGPASTLRAIFEVGAASFVDALGFASEGHLQPLRNSVAAIVRAGSVGVSLIVGNWGEPCPSTR